MNNIYKSVNALLLSAKQGVKRIFDEMPDICIDVPAAYSVLEKMGDKMFQLGVLSEALYKDLPARYFSNREYPHFYSLMRILHMSQV